MSCCNNPSPRDPCPSCEGKLCENCGLCSVCDVPEETPIRAVASVTPIAPMSQCAGCGATVRHEDRMKLEAHKDGCPQPEIRMKRLEREVAQLKDVVLQLVSANNDTVTNQCDLNTRLLALEGWRERQVSEFNQDTVQLLHAAGLRLTFVEQRLGLTYIAPPKEDHGTSEAIPDTQPSGFAERVRAGNELDTDGWVKRAEAADPGEPPTDPSAADAAGSAYVGPDAARSESERTS